MTQLVWQHLTETARKGRLPHAILLHGSANAEAIALGRDFAQFLLCEVSPSIKACGQCRSCQLFQTHHHPDFLWVAPLPDKKWIGVDQVREMLDWLQQTSHRGLLQVVLLAPAQLQVGGANALLKTLEEPTGPVVFLLVTAHTHFLPLTVLSRCQQVALPGATDFLSALTEQETLGALLLALCRCETDPLTVAATLAQWDMGKLGEVWCIFLLNVARFQVGVAAEFPSHSTVLVTIAALAAVRSQEWLSGYMDQLSRDFADYRRHPGLNATLLLETSLFRWQSE